MARTPGRLHGGVLDQNRPASASRAGAIVLDMPVGRSAVLAGGMLTHRRHDDAIAQGTAAQLHAVEQPAGGLSHLNAGMISWANDSIEAQTRSWGWPTLCHAEYRSIPSSA